MTAESPIPVPAAAGTLDPGPRDATALRVWAPRAAAVELRLRRPVGEDRDEEFEEQVIAMTPEDGGWHAAPQVTARSGDRYAFRLDGAGPWLPDPRSVLQPDGVHGDSEVVDLAALPRDASWQGRDLRGGVVYEMHVGTFTPGPDGQGGTFDSAIERLDDLVALGVDALEVMPVAAFPGARGWGYDGVDLYATHVSYGGPEAFARFVAAAHERGLAVILDVVHNHLGPTGNYLASFGPYFTDAHHTPWGSAVNLDDRGCAEVRAFLLGNARQWLVDMHLDGLRLDAVHELRDDSDRHILAELSDAVRSWERDLGRPLVLIAESDHNDPRTVTPTDRGGLGMDMQWADDVHHAVHAWSTGEREGYYGDFGGASTLAKTLTRIFEHDGSYSSFREQDWGAPVDPRSPDYDAHSFVAFLQDHDQVGNRATGDRIDESVEPRVHAAAAALVLCGAPTAMLFQGEEWAASTPFAFFTDHDEELGPLVSAGRAEEFAKMGWGAEVPDPQDPATFRSSILRWSERAEGEHARMLAWYRRLLELRRTESDLRDPSLEHVRVEVLSEETVVMARGRIAVLAHRGAGPVDAAAHAGGEVEVLASFGTSPQAPAHLAGPGAVVMRRR